MNESQAPLMSRIRADVQAMHAYVVQPATGMVKLDAMENPYTLSSTLQAALGARLGAVAVNRYPGVRVDDLKAALASYVQMPSGYALMLGNGSDELISLLALACDIRIAAPGAKLGLPEVHLGLIPGYGGTQRLPRLIGAGRALDLMLSGRHVLADEALSMGLVNYVKDNPLEYARQYLESVLDRGAPLSFGLIKEAVRRGMDSTFSDGLEIEADLFGLISSSEDRKEGTKAFVEKRKANFKGE